VIGKMEHPAHVEEHRVDLASECSHAQIVKG
jgi:hypothetical protein